MAYDGNEIYTTPAFIESMKSHQTTINPSTRGLHLYRLVKAYLRGYSIVRPEHQVYLKNCYHFYGDDQPKEKGIPQRTDQVRDIRSLNDGFKELLEHPIVKLNLTKNSLIDFSLPIENRLDQISTPLSRKRSDSLPVYDKRGRMVLKQYRNAQDIPSNHQCVDDTIFEDLSHMKIIDIITC